MKALILNSGQGTQKGHFSSQHPKCMTELQGGETILSRQLRLLAQVGITQAVITTGPFTEALMEYCDSLDLPVEYIFVDNPRYMETSDIYSIYLARDHLRDDDILLFHGDMVFEETVLDRVLRSQNSVLTVNSAAPLLEKDFKAVITDGRIAKVRMELFHDAVIAQPIYRLRQEDWKAWLNEIAAFCERGEINCYAEDAFNRISDHCTICPLDVRDDLCRRIDTQEDLAAITQKLRELAHRTVFMSFSTDVIHSGHLAILNKAAHLGELTVGVLADSAVASFKRYPLLPFEERKNLFENLKGVSHVIRQDTPSYKDVIKRLRPDIIVHGDEDDWRQGFLRPIREEAEALLREYGGRIVEYPYSGAPELQDIERRSRADAALPDIRRSRLKKLLELKGFVRIIEAHSGLSGLIAETATVYQNGGARSYDGMWLSSLCDSTMKGKPDIELVDMTSRMQTINEIMDVTTKPIILDGDTGGLNEHFVYHVKTLERMGVSAIIIEDKMGLKKNSLFGTEVKQQQDSIENFCSKIQAGKHAMRTKDFMIIARIESLILERGMEDALKRAFAYTQAGADGIMIHSRRKEPDEIFEFIDRFREKNEVTPLVVVPTSFNAVTEEEFQARGVNIVIYANQLIRSAFPAMMRTAECILEHHRAKEVDDQCLPIKEILTLIPEKE